MQHNLSENFKKHPYYTAFQKIAKRLNQSGAVCWLAGGAVRDMLLGRPVNDFDLVTDTNLKDLKSFFPNAVLVGASFGVIKASETNDENQEVLFDLAVFRKEYEYQDGRHPSKVTEGTAKEDSFRRDFTINALYWDDTNQKIIDYVGGVSDLQNKLIVAVGDAKERFLEDHLRILRLLRFHVQLGFQMQRETLHHAVVNVGLLKKISGERIWEEFKKMARARNYQAILDNELGVLVLNEVFEVSIVNKDELKSIGQKNDLIEDQSLLLTAFLNFIFVAVGEVDKVRNALQKRLHVSKKELTQFDRLVRVKTDLQVRTTEEIILEIEKDLELLSIFHFLEKLGQFESTKLQDIENLMNNKQTPVVEPRDIKDWMPAKKMTKALMEVRLRELQGAIKSKEQGIQYLRLWLKRQSY